MKHNQKCPSCNKQPNGSERQLLPVNNSKSKIVICEGCGTHFDLHTGKELSCAEEL